MLDEWRTRFPIASFVLIALQRKADTPNTRLSRAETLLLTVCNFWAAATARQLAAHLRPRPDEKLRAAYVALAATGANGVARVVHAMIGDAPLRPADEWLVTSSRRLEDAVANSSDNFDELIASFAITHLSLDGINAGSSAISDSMRSR